MKKVSILLFVLATILWAEIDIEIAIQIDNLPEEIFEIYNMDEKNGDCAIYNGKRTKSDFGACGYDGLCAAILDIDVLFGWTGVSNNGLEIYTLTGATHSWREVLEDEFNHFRQCKGIIANDSTYNSMFAEIDSFLVPEIDKYLQNESQKRIMLVYNYAMGSVRPAEIAIPGGGCDLCFIGMASDTVKARNAAISSIAPPKYKLETIYVQNHRLTASPKLLGSEFTLFDVNGHELRRGTLQNNMQLPAYPTIIKIQGFGTRLLNSR